ncbi:MAG: gliding motility-associated C-terminal domain-containing protein [Bacteroidia bacterium]
MIKIRLHIFFINLFLVPVDSGFAQSTYPNIDFESGNLSGWNAATGFCCPIATPVNGIAFNQHTLMSGNGTDPYALGQIPIVAPGGNYSVRLGNDSVNSEAERLSYTFTVSPAAPLFVYRYAVVFQFPPDHPEAKQPRFEISVKDANGDMITCGFYQVVCSNLISGFFSNGDIRYKKWTDVGVDLTDYIGQQITIEFATGDCGMGGHFGYAYIDGYATELKITAGNCNPDGSITLTAPPGFEYSWSNGEASQQINLFNYNGGGEISVTLSAVTGCSKTISYIIQDFVPHADFDYDLKCGNKVEFTDGSSVNNAVINNWIWNFGDLNLSSDINPTHQYASQNTFSVSLVVTASNNCKGLVTKNIAVENLIQAGFSFDGECEGNEISFTDNSTTISGKIILWKWNFGDDNFSAAQNSFHNYVTSGIYFPKLVIVSDEGCIDSVSEEISINDCSPETIFVPNAFSPNGDGMNDFFTISGNKFSGIHIDIFNRWGEVVFTSSENNFMWDGKNNNGKLLPEGIYTYRMNTTGISDNTRNFTGYIALLR